MKSIDLNCDLGESYYTKKVGNDEAIIPLITSCNIACGFHGGDPTTIKKAIELALKHKVNIGAHPSFFDLDNFGRSWQNITTEELENILLYQIGALKTITETLGGKLRHVKPHGALYNMASKDYTLALTIAKTIQKIDSKLIFMGMANTVMFEAAKNIGLNFKHEVFADRNYTEDGFLVSRQKENAVLYNTSTINKHIENMIIDNTIVTQKNTKLSVTAESICVHGDSNEALAIVKSLRNHLQKLNIPIKGF